MRGQRICSLVRQVLQRAKCLYEPELFTYMSKNNHSPGW